MPPSQLCPYTEPSKRLAWFDRQEYRCINFRVRREVYDKALPIWRRVVALGQKAYVEAPDLVEKLMTFRAPLPSERTDPYSWAYIGVQLPDDLGAGYDNSYLRELFSKRYAPGNTLELMCGFQSYWEPQENLTVTAVDYCREMLELYAYPLRRRILCDLNAVRSVDDLSFVEPGSIDIVSICFGYRYVKYPVVLMSIVRELLKLTGKIIFIEHPDAGYERLTKQEFSVDRCYRHLERGGFMNIGYEKISTPSGNEHFLIEASNGRKQ